MASEELRFVVLGKTGVGKSSSINTIVGKKVCKVTASSQSVTKHCQLIEEDVLGKHLIIVDTPGLFDTDSTEEETRIENGKIIGLTSPGFHAFIIVIRIGRFTKEEFQSICIMAERFGPELFKRTVLLFTGVDNLETDGVTFKQYLKDDKTTDLHDLIEKCGGRVVGFNNRNLQDTRQVEELMILVGTVEIATRGRYYTNSLYDKAEKILEDEETGRLAKDKQKSRSVIRKEIRKDIADETGTGKHLLSFLIGEVAIPVVLFLAKAAAIVGAGSAFL